MHALHVLHFDLWTCAATRSDVEQQQKLQGTLETRGSFWAEKGGLGRRPRLG